MRTTYTNSHCHPVPVPVPVPLPVPVPKPYKCKNKSEIAAAAAAAAMQWQLHGRHWNVSAPPSLLPSLSHSHTLFLNWIRDAPWARPNKKKGWTYRLARVDVVRGNSDYRHREAAGKQAGSGRKLLLTIDLTFVIRNILNAYWAHLREERTKRDVRLNRQKLRSSLCSRKKSAASPRF